MFNVNNNTNNTTLTFSNMAEAVDGFCAEIARTQHHADITLTGPNEFHEGIITEYRHVYAQPCDEDRCNWCDKNPMNW